MIKDILGAAEKLGSQIAQSGLASSQPQKIVSVPSSQYAYFLLKPFKDNEYGPAYRQGFLKNFVGGSHSFTFYISGNKNDIKIYARVDREIALYFENVLHVAYPTADILTCDHLPIWGQSEFINFHEKTEIAQESFFIQQGTYFDPLKDLGSLYDSIPAEARLTFSFEYSFSQPSSFRKQLFEKIQSFFERISQNTKKSDDDQKEGESPKIDCYLVIGYALLSQDQGLVNSVKGHIKSLFRKYCVEGSFTVSGLALKKPMMFSQAINFFHFPTKDYSIKGLDYSVYRKLPSPQNLATPENSDKDDLTILGKTEYKGEPITFGIKREDKFRHMYIIGKSGTGKSTFLSNLLKSDMMTNKGLALIDPHGELVEDIMPHIPSHRINDVILFDVSDTNFPIGFNLLQYRNQEEKMLIASGVLGTFKKLFDNSRGPRLEYILRNVILSVIEYPNATLQHILRIMIEKDFRQEVLTHVTDAVVIKFWEQEYNKWTDKFRDEAIAPITNKVGQFLSSPIVRNIFGQPQSKLNIRECMDSSKILLINLSKGKIGEDNSAMIGSFLVTKFQIDAMARADMPSKDRKDFYLYIDEFQNFATDSFAEILSEARKYKLSLIVANQYTSQLTEKIRDAIFGNVGTIISFTLGYDDAKIMALQYKEMVTPNDFLSLPRFKAYIKLMTDGIIADPFSMSTLPLSKPEHSEEIKEKVRKQSRQRYAIEKEKLEQLLTAWNNKTFSLQEKIMEKSKSEGVMQDGPGLSVGVQKVFSVDDIVLGERYDGYVKIIYNYGIFITVKGVEGLLHKNVIKPLDGVQRKDFYQPGDKIKVKAIEFKDVKGEKKVVRSQL